MPQWSNYCLSLCCVDEEERVEERKKRVLGEKSISGNLCYQAAFPEAGILFMYQVGMWGLEHLFYRVKVVVVSTEGIKCSKLLPPKRTSTRVKFDTNE